MSTPTTPPDGSQRRSDGTELARAQRERIMDAMAATVAERSYERATVRAVVARAHVSATTYYDFFEDKEDCFLATADQRIERVIESVTTACGSAPDGSERFRAGLQGFLDLCAREPDTAHVCVVELGAAGPAAQARRNDMVERLSGLAGSALAAMSGETQARLASTIVVGGVLHLVADRIAKGRTADLPNLAPELLRLVVPAFSGD